MVPNTLTLKLYVVKEKVQNDTKSIKVTSKCLRIHVQKAYHPVCLENTQSTWVYGIAYDFRTIKGPKLKNLFQNRDVYCSC